MKFDIKAHLQNHAYYFKQSKEINKDDLHFNFSFLDIQFFNKDKTPETTLFELLQELKKETSYKVKNGYYTTKDEEKKQKYTTRKINLQNAIKIEAIHIEGSEGEYTMPHIHLILSKDARLGKDFSLLKTHIIEVSKKFGLRPNFAEIAPNNPASYKNLAKAVKNFSWIIRKMPNKDFKKYVETKLQDKLEKLWEYTLLSGNLQYYIKTLEFIKKRLNRQKIVFEWQGHNLRNTYPIPLTEQDLQVIELINNKRFSQKDIKPYLNNAILRDFVRYSYFKDKSKALIINSLSKQTELLQNLRPNKKVIDNYLKLYQKILDQDKQTQIKEQEKQKEVQSIKEILKEDLLKVAKNSINEKELRAGMQKLGYIDFGFKKRGGKVIGYQFKLPQEDKKIIVKCSDIIPISDIRAILKENWIKSKKNEPIKNDITHERSQINTYLLPKPVEAPKPVPVIYKKDQIQAQKEKTKEKIKKLRLQRRENARNYQRIRELIAIAKRNTRTELETKRRIIENTRELNQVSEREYRIENENQTIRREVASIRERITNTIKSVATGITKAIGTTITNAIKSVREKLKRVIREKDPKFAYIKENLKILKNSKLYQEFIKTIDKQAPNNEEEYQKWLNTDPYSDEKFKEYLLKIDDFELQNAVIEQIQKELNIENQRDNSNYLSL